MTASIGTRLALLESHVSELRKHLGTMPTQEVAWRMHQAERELRLAAELHAAQAKAALADNVHSLEALLAEAEGLVWFLKGGR